MNQVWKLLDKQYSERIAYINARVLDPKSNTDIINCSLITEGDKIVNFGPSVLQGLDLDSAFDKVIDCKGLVLIPGLLDIHVHFREPGYEYKETIETGSKSAAAGGVTTVVCQPNTSPNINDVKVVRYIKSRPHYVRIECYASVTHSETKNLTDMMSLAQEGVVGFTDDGLPVQDSSLMRSALEYSKILDLPIAQHAEDVSLSCCGSINEGVMSDKLSISGANKMSEAIMVARDLLLLKITGGYYHILHVSAKETLELITQYKEKGYNVTCEVAPHHFSLNHSEVDGHNCFAKVNPPLRSEDDRISMIEGLRSGVIDCIASDHAPHETQSKTLGLEKSAFGMVGLETILPLSLDLYHSGEMSLMDVLSKLTYKPAQIIRKEHLGIIKCGGIADFCLLDLDKEWFIDSSKFSSKSHNSPFDRRKVKGLVVRTVVGGQSVYIMEN